MKKEKEKKLEAVRHSLSHILMQALENLYGAIPGVGPEIEDGFYHDFDSKNQITLDDLPKIENEMKEIIKKNYKIEKEEMEIDRGIKFLKDKKYIYTAELAEDLKKKGEKKISFYRQDNFVNMCKGPHVESTGKVNYKAFKLTKVAGAYWKGSEKNKMIQRIYALAYENPKDLKKHISMLEEAKKRDHRKIGKEMDLFSLHEEGPGFPFWHSKGVILYNELESFIRKENSKRNYSEIKTPIILNKDLWVTSGHWDKFGENMYFTEIDSEEYAIKPMNCPGGLLIYKNKKHSYKELPIRRAELGLVHRHELSGVLHGLFRVRSFTQDDAHSFCSPKQIEEEIIDMVSYAMDVYSSFDFNEYEIFIATRPEKYIGSDKDWDKSTKALTDALSKKKLAYKIKEGEGAFYGPKIEFNIKDSIGRNWQCGTIQVDFSMSKRFEAVYIDKDGKEKTPVMIHRAILGSLERFLGILIENYAGIFPVWLSPVQVKIIAVGEGHVDYCKKLAAEFKEKDIRAEVDSSDETVGNKIRKSTQEKPPYILVIGDKEAQGKKLNVRDRGGRETREIKKDEFFDEILKKINDKN
jgi:threonyl-tRNA synthetase